MSGFVSLVGAGPGDPGLLTLAGRDRLAAAEVVVYDRLVGPEIVALSSPAAEMVYAGKTPEHHTLTQDEINALLIEHGRAGKRVVRLKGGDPFVFGRGGEEALALAAASVPFEVVPGVTSAVAVPAYAGVPVTHRGLASSFAVITGHEDDTKEEASVDWSRLAHAVDTLVVLMGGAALAGIARALVDAGKSPDTPCVSIESGTTPSQRSVSAGLSSIAATVREAGLGTPLLTVIGDVAGLGDHIAWFGRGRLGGKRVLVTRATGQAGALSTLLRREGAIAVEAPALEIVPAGDESIGPAVELLRSAVYTWCPFTSVNAVDIFFAALQRRRLDARAFGHCHVAAIGAATAAALRTHGIEPDLIAENETSEGLAEALEGISGRVLLPTAADSRRVLPDRLRARELEVDEVVLYETRVPALDGPMDVPPVDAAVFASSSAVRNLHSLLGPRFDDLRSATIACIGPITAQTAREHGLTVAVQPANHTIPAVVEALAEHFARHPSVKP